MRLPTPITLFISFAQEDQSSLRKLEIRLSQLKQQGLISTWHNQQITAGANVPHTIDQHLKQANLILLLVSPDFLASDVCTIQMQHALEQHKSHKAILLPLILRPCDWTHAPFAHLPYLPSNGKPITTWDNRDTAWNEVVQGLRQIINPPPSPSPLPPTKPIWNVPYPRNPVFTGRESLLTQLTSVLQAGEAAALSQPQAISGLGGIGKTQIALEYAYRFRSYYQAVLWAQADTLEHLTSSYLAFATLLNLAEKDEQESARVILAVKNWLQNNTNWLLILDNADELPLARDFLPPSTGGHVLLTTRAQAPGRFAHRVEVDTFSTELGALFLLRRAALLPTDAPLAQIPREEANIARIICEELGGLPLALDQAGAYIEETSCSLSAYQLLFQHRRTDLLAERRGQLVDDHPHPVATTWSLSFENVERKNPAAADLLRLCAFLVADAIPETIITQGATHLGPHLAPVAADPYLLNQAIEALRAYSLLSRDARSSNPTLSVHRLVQAVLKDQMSKQEQHQWAERTVRAVEAALPLVEHKTQAQWEPILAHALRCSELITQEHLHFSSATLLLHQTGWYLTERIRYKEAEHILKQTLAMTEQEHGLAHLDTARDSSTLANLYSKRGKYAQAEPLYERALGINEEQLGAEHPDTATSLNNLALLYRKRGKYEQAEALYERALVIREQELGAEHPDTATSLNNLALLYNKQGKYEQAEPLLVRALKISEEQLGAEHPDTATSLNNLAVLYDNQGKYEQAEPLLVRALKISEEQLGAEHPDTAQSLNNLAFLYDNQGKYEQAEPLLVRALAIYEQELGAEHPSTATNLNNLAVLYNNQGKYEQAEPLFQRALTIREQSLGSEHPDTANSLWCLAFLSEQQQHYQKAKRFYQRALSIYERTLGTEHPSTQRVQQEYTALLKIMKQDEETI